MSQRRHHEFTPPTSSSTHSTEVLALLLSFALFMSCAPLCSSEQPNLILILADDLGIGDLGCYGNATIKTPNIDRMASDGVLFEQMISADPLCTPSRAALLTGRLPIRSGMAHLVKRILLFPAEPGGLPREEVTIAEVLKNVGYRTALIGKWHQGVNKENWRDGYHLPIHQGFDYYYGLPLTLVRDCGNTSLLDFASPNWNRNYSIASSTVLIGLLVAMLSGFLHKAKGLILILLLSLLFGGIYCVLSSFNKWFCLLYRNNELLEQPLALETLAPRLVAEALAFIESSASMKKPFFLFYAMDMVHTPLTASPSFKGRSSHGLYGDVVEEMDSYVGQIIRKLEELNVVDNTLVIFTSDNGPHKEELQEGGSTGIFSGGKGQTWEGGIRIPAVALWPEELPKGLRFKGAASLMDLFNTFVAAGNASQFIPQDRVVDGVDLLPYLFSHKQYGDERRFLYHYCGTKLAAVRYRQFKAHLMTQQWEDSSAQICPSTVVCPCTGPLVQHHNPPLLFDLVNDPSERFPLDTSLMEYREILKVIDEAIAAHNQTLSAPGGLPAMSQLNFLPRVKLQPCCNFPFCSCSEENIG